MAPPEHPLMLTCTTETGMGAMSPLTRFYYLRWLCRRLREES